MQLYIYSEKNGFATSKNCNYLIMNELIKFKNKKRAKILGF